MIQGFFLFTLDNPAPPYPLPSIPTPPSKASAYFHLFEEEKKTKQKFQFSVHYVENGSCSLYIDSFDLE